MGADAGAGPRSLKTNICGMMNKTGSIRLCVTLLLAVSLLGACIEEGPAVPDKSEKIGRLKLIASIEGSSATPATRAKLLDQAGEGGGAVRPDDLWSYWQFSVEDFDGDGKEDRLGFFAKNGAANGGSIENAAMTYVETKGFGTFTSDDDVDLAKLSPESSFFYFPYDPNANTTGIELRRKDPRAAFQGDTLKCVDFLLMEGFDASVLDAKGYIDGGQFYHGFSELIIMRGAGFDKPKDGNYTLKVYLKKPYTHLMIEPTAKGWAPKLVNTPENAQNGAVANSNGTEDDYRVWEAWHGHPYEIDGSDGAGTKRKQSVDAWYVLLPTVAADRAEVDYIEIVDNEGTTQRVSSLKFTDDPKGNNTNVYSKKLTPGWRYPFQISMQELEPTVTPFPITPWEEEVTITEERARGITDLSDYQNWVAAYNSFLKSGRNEEDKNESTAGGDQNVTHKDRLLQYGDRVVDQEGKLLYWHFYLRTDLKFSEEDTAFLLPELQDVLDGKSDEMSGSVFKNHTIAGLKKPFIEKLTGPYAVVQNLTFQEPVINYLQTKESVGVVAQTVSGGATVRACTVLKGNILADAPVGMVAGTIDGDGSVTDCVLSGFLFGTATYNKIVGTLTGTGRFENNNANSVIFNDKN